MAQTIEYNIKVNDQGAATTIGQLEGQLSDLNEEIKQVPVNSKRFNELKKEINSVEADLEGANQALARFTAEDKVRAFQGSVDVLGGAISGTAGAAALFNVESEKFDELTARAAGAIAFAQGLKQGADGAIALTQSLQKSQKAQKLFASAQALVNTGLGKFKIALAATGIGALVVGIGLLISNFDKVSAAVKKFIGNSKILTSIVDTARNAFNSFVDAIRPALEFLGILPDEAERAEIAIRETATAAASAAEKELARAQARGASAKELFDIEQELLENKIKSLEDAEEKEQAIFDLELLRLKEGKRLADEAAAEQKIRDDEAAARRQEKIDQAKADQEAAEQAEKDRLQRLADISKDFEKRAEDDAAETEVQKLELEKERQLRELEQLQATEEQKLEIIKYYDNLIAETEAEQKEADDQAKADADALELERLTTLEQEKLNLKKDSLQTLSELFGQETALGKAALLAKQAILVQELIQNAKSTLGLATKTATDSTLKGADAVGSIAQGTANTARVGFPQNIPLLIGYAAQAVGIISAVKSAVSTAKNVSAQVGAAGGGPSANLNTNVPTGANINTANIDLGTNPETQVRGEAVRAYVVSGDITSNQEAEAKLSTRRTISG